MKITIDIPNPHEMSARANSFKGSPLFTKAIEKTLKYNIKRIKVSSNEGKRYIWIPLSSIVSSVDDYYKELNVDRTVFNEAVVKEVIDTLVSAGYATGERRPGCISLVW